MANPINELNPGVKPEGTDVSVVQTQIPVKVGFGSLLFEIMLWCLLIVPGVVFLIMKIQAGAYLRSVEQKIQHNASQIDNYLEQRVMILQNAAQLVDKAVELDKEVMTQVAKYRGGNQHTDAERNTTSTQVDRLFHDINVAYEAYPDLKAHNEIENALKQNSYLQKEITAARELYNDTVYEWNTAIQQWPTKMIVAARAGYTTRIPFTTSAEVKERARGTFFDSKPAEKK